MITSNPVPASQILPPSTAAFAPREGGVRIALSSTEGTSLGFDQLDSLTNNEAQKGILRNGEIQITRIPSGSRFLPFGGYHVTTPVASAYVPFPDAPAPKNLTPGATRVQAQQMLAPKAVPPAR